MMLDDSPGPRIELKVKVENFSGFHMPAERVVWGTFWSPKANKTIDIHRFALFYHFSGVLNSKFRSKSGILG